MDDFRAEVLEGEAKKKRRGGLFGRRSSEPAVQVQPQPKATEKPVASPQPFKESPWVQRAQAGKLPATEYDSREIAQGRDVISQIQQEARKAKRVNTARAKLGLDQP